MHSEAFLFPGVVGRAVQIYEQFHVKIQRSMEMYKPFNIAEAHSCTCVSGIFDESCIAGVTMFIDSLELPRDKNMCPRSTRAQTVSRFKSSALAIFNVSRRYRLKMDRKKKSIMYFFFKTSIYYEGTYLASLYLAAKNSCRPWI